MTTRECPKCGGVKRVCKHKNKQLGYIAWHEWAAKQKVKQTQCPVCKLWLFPEEI